MFFEQFERLCKKNNSNPTSTVKKLGYSSSKVTAWKNNSIPKYEILTEIADYFHVSISYLFLDNIDIDYKDYEEAINNHSSDKNITNSESIASNIELDNIKLSEIEIELLNNFNKLSEIDKGRILGILEEKVNTAKTNNSKSKSTLNSKSLTADCQNNETA